MEALVADIGGTHARFALARYEGGRLVGLSHAKTLISADYPGLIETWHAYARLIERSLPDQAALAIAAPVHDPATGRTGGAPIRFTNLDWVVEQEGLAERLNLSRLVMLNDFAAVAHAAQHQPDIGFTHLCGPDMPLPALGTLAILGPGTGLGVACLLRHKEGYRVLASEGGHIGFAPRDALEDAILSELRQCHDRVSAERVVSGSGLPAIYRVLSRQTGKPCRIGNEIALWQAALNNTDAMARAALDRYCGILGAVAGDFALAYGAAAVVLDGGLGRRLAPILPQSDFAQGFADKGRYQANMAALPVKMLNCAEPGLTGAAAALLEQP